MTPEERMRAAPAPKSAEDSRATSEMAPPPGTGRPVPANFDRVEAGPLEAARRG